MDFEMNLNTVAYSQCRNCRFFNIVLNDDGTGGNACLFLGGAGNYLPFTVVKSRVELCHEIEDYKKNILPHDCGYYSQSCMQVMCGEDFADALADQEWNDYSMIDRRRISEIDFGHPMFNYLREVDPSFMKRMEAKANDQCWGVFKDDGIAAFMTLEVEKDDVDYSRILPAPPHPFFAKGRRRMRLSDFICDHERAPFGMAGLLKIAMLMALENRVDEIYAVSYSRTGLDEFLGRNGFSQGYWDTGSGGKDDIARNVSILRMDVEK